MRGHDGFIKEALEGHSSFSGGVVRSMLCGEKRPNPSGESFFSFKKQPYIPNRKKLAKHVKKKRGKIKLSAPGFEPGWSDQKCRESVRVVSHVNGRHHAELPYLL